MSEIIGLTAGAWTSGDSASRVEFTREVMEEIRLRALAGYKVLPRVGVGVGGLLLGERGEDGVRITGYLALPCSHRFGPGFVLDPHEKSDVRDLILESRKQEAVGWYFSRLRGEVELTEQDRELARDLFGGRNPVTLVMKPSPDAPVQAAVYIPGRNGELEQGSSLQSDSPAEPEVPKVPEEPASRALAVIATHKHVRLPLEPLPEIEPDPGIDPDAASPQVSEPEPERSQREGAEKAQIPPPPSFPIPPSFLPALEREDIAAYGRLPGDRKPKPWTRLVTVGAALIVGLTAFAVQEIWLVESPAVQTQAPPAVR